MRKGRLVGALVLTGVAIGGLLSYLLPEFNFGLGSGGGLGNPPAQKAETTPVSDNEKPGGAPETVAETPAETETVQQPAAPTDVIYVLIDGKNYLLRQGPEGKVPYKPATLDEIVGAAQAATGDETGIRVRVAQKSTSREITERTLRSKLEEAGIPSDSVRWPDIPLKGDATQ
jgi:hypothetical protein